MDDRHQTAFTLPELLVTLAVIALLAGVAVPATVDLLQNARLRSAVEALLADIRLARELTLRTGTAYFIVFTRASPQRWCYRVTADAKASCDASRDGVPNAVVSEDYPGVRLDQVGFAGGRSIAFTAPRGTARAGRVTLGNDRRQVAIVVSLLGRTRVCADKGGAYPPC
jgi:prepilin-type N-terminal cleavage/methylation domain-containing protein